MKKNAKLHSSLVNNLSIWKFLLIPVLFYSFMMVLPLITAAIYALFDWKGGPLKAEQFIGLDNFAEMLRDKTFWESFLHSCKYTVLLVVGQILIALFLTLFYSTKWLKFVAFHRFVIFLPVVISPVVIGLLWQMIYNSNFGLLNHFLRALGMESAIRLWLDDPKIAIWTTAIPLIWQYIGFYFVIMCSAVSSIPQEILEAAELDGCTGWKKAIHVQIPMIYDTLGVCIIISVIGALRVFDHILIMTNGGPGSATQTMALYTYNAAFQKFRLGYSNALAIGMLVLTMLVTIVVKYLLGRKKYD